MKRFISFLFVKSVMMAWILGFSNVSGSIAHEEELENREVRVPIEILRAVDVQDIDDDQRGPCSKTMTMGYGFFGGGGWGALGGMTLNNLDENSSAIMPWLLGGLVLGGYTGYLCGTTLSSQVYRSTLYHPFLIAISLLPWVVSFIIEDYHSEIKHIRQ